MNAPLISAGTAAALELGALRRVVAELAATDLGRSHLLALAPHADREAFDAHRRELEDARRLIGGRPLVPLLDRPVRGILDAVARDASRLEGSDLVVLGDVLSAVHRAAERIAESDPPCAALLERVETLPDVDPLRRLLRRTFDARGEIREDATPRLAELRGRIRTVRQGIYERLAGMVEEHREHLSEETIPMRAGRLVLVLRSGARGRVPGLVHGRSASGRSFYFEPLDAVESNNRLQQAVEDEEIEKRRVVREVLDRLRESLEAIEAHAGFLARLDLLQASVRFAQRCDGRLAEVGSRHELRLVAARHPLLDPRLADLRSAALGTPGHTDAIVPLDLELSAERRVLVLTGPNAGGKTVTLKTLGLLVAAHQCGLPIPVADGSRLPFCEGLVATVGDDQDLLTDRSTFSGRLQRLDEAWRVAGPDSLLLLDELGSGTDPEEGTALSVALLEHLVARRSLVLVTTHLGRLAAMALETDGAFCAAMQFDGSTGQPTYRLMAGPPGGSEAVALARRLGLPTPWLERTEELLGDEHRDLRRLLAEIEEHRRELEAERERLAIEVADAQSLRARLAQREEELRVERKSLAKKVRQEVDTFRRETRQSLRRELEKLQAVDGATARRREAVAAEEKLFAAPPRVEEPEAAEAEERPLVVAGPVRHRRAGWTG
ncbi:MAG: hypothetical protein AAGN46_00870, partial [Acidobacteriota bacterium]